MELAVIQNKIYQVRGHNIMLDFDLAELYEVETRVLKQAVRRNIDIFPEEFMFELTREEYNFLRSQVVTLERGKGKHSKYLPFAFTEHGVTMLANVLKSKKARMRCMAIVRAFISMKHFILNYKELADKIALLEQKYNKNFRDVYEVLDLLLNDKKVQEDLAKRKRIGFKIAQNLWLQLREAEVNVRFLPGKFYGSVEPMCRIMLFDDLTRERIKNLQMWIEGDEEGDACEGTIIRKK